MFIFGYEIKKVEVDGHKYFAVYEKATEQNIKTFKTFNKAREFTRLMKKHGFTGWTPSFFLAPVFVVK